MASADRLIEVFNEAKARPAGAERERFLAGSCPDDPALKEQVISLLRAHEGAGDFLKHTQLISPASLLTEKPGDRIGRYKLLQQIGEGGCGVVYMAEQEEPVRRRVALKVIKLGMDTKQVIARFEAERQALALMDHPNIAKVLDAGATETGRPYFVMELVRGIKITGYCDENKLSTQDRLKLFIQVCQAIQHAHQKGIIHRDIKPSNVLVTVSEPGAPGCPKVIDFGIAKATTGQRLTDKTVFTAFEQFIGTPAYMSPEQAMLTSLDIDTRADIYALGVLLYELLTGQTPFDANELLQSGLDEMRRTIREKEPLKPSTRLTQELVAAPRQNGADSGDENGGALPRRRYAQIQLLIHLIRGDLDWIVMKCLEKDRTRRYETANGLAFDIQRHLNNEPVNARPPSGLYRLQKAIRRNKLAFAAGAAMAVVLMIGVVVSTSEAIRATRAEREQTRLRQIAETKEKKSQQVAQFLKEMLNGVGPSVALGRDTTMLREIVDKTAERVGKDLTNQPELEVELYLTLADTYRDLALFNQMEGMARHGLQLARSSLGEENESVAKSLISLGEALRHSTQKQLGVVHFSKVAESEIYRRQHNTNLAEAEICSRVSLAMSRKLLGNENPTVANGLYELAMVFETQYRMAEAETRNREALAMYKKLLGNEHPKVAAVLLELAVVLAYQDKSLAEAENLIRKALVIQRKLLGPEHPEIARALNILAIVTSLQGRWPEAETSFRESLAMWKKLQASERPEFADELHNLGYALMEQDKLAEAETSFREALAMRRRLFGNEHLDVADSLHKLAKMVALQGRLAEAETICREELAMQRKFQPADRMELASTLNNLGNILMLQGKLAEAEPVLREAVAMQGRLPDNEQVERGLSLGNLARLLQLEGKLAEAESNYREALAVQRKLVGNEHPDVVDSLNQLADFLQQQGRLAEARPLAEEAVAICLRHPGQDEFLPLDSALKHVLTVLGDTAAVDALNAQLLQRFRKNAEGGDAAALNNLAWFLATCPDSKFRDGTNAVVCGEKAVAATNRKNTSYLDTLAAAYAEAGQFAKATSIVKEALALPQIEGGESALTSRLKLYETNSPYRDAD